MDRPPLPPINMIRDPALPLCRTFGRSRAEAFFETPHSLDWRENFFPGSISTASHFLQRMGGRRSMAPVSKQTSASEELQYASGGLKRETGWWGAFVIGLAGTILVTGIAPVMVTQIGASGVPINVFITHTGWLVCLLFAELVDMLSACIDGT